jgi:hypothetical protein
MSDCGAGAAIATGNVEAVLRIDGEVFLGSILKRNFKKCGACWGKLVESTALRRRSLGKIQHTPTNLNWLFLSF